MGTQKLIKDPHGDLGLQIAVLVGTLGGVENCKTIIRLYLVVCGNHCMIF